MTIKDLAKLLVDYLPDKILFLGLGNEHRGDDGAGLVFLDRLKCKTQFSKSLFFKAGTNPENYLHYMLNSKADVIVIIDAAYTGNDPGRISLLDASEIDKLKISTHSYSVKLIEDYLTAHRKFKFIYIVIEPEVTSFAKKLSDSVNKGIDLFFKE